MPASRFVPQVIVTGRSVFSRRVTHGTPSTVRLLLDPAGIGDDQPRVREQAEELEIAERVEEPQPLVAPRGRSRPAPCGSADGRGTRPACARPARRSASRRARSAAASSTFDGRWSVSTRVVARAAPGARHLERLGARAEGEQRVDHDVADEVDASRRRPPRARGSRSPLRSLTNSQSRDRVGHDAVDLLRHGPIEAAQPGFDVRDRDSELRRDERGRHRRVHVADDEHRRGPPLEQAPARCRIMISAVCGRGSPSRRRGGRPARESRAARRRSPTSRAS